MKFTKKEQSLVPTKEVLNEIQKFIACKQPEQLVMLGSSDGKHIDTVFFVDKMCIRDSKRHRNRTTRLCGSNYLFGKL